MQYCSLEYTPRKPEETLLYRVYDAVGNRLSSLGVASYAYNVSNELTNLPGVSYTYDDNGSLLTKNDGTNYSWIY
jgi:hypothetical protein